MYNQFHNKICSYIWNYRPYLQWCIIVHSFLTKINCVHLNKQKLCLKYIEALHQLILSLFTGNVHYFKLVQIKGFFMNYTKSLVWIKIIIFSFTTLSPQKLCLVSINSWAVTVSKSACHKDSETVVDFKSWWKIDWGI